ncbi:MAG: ABC transporter permease [Bacillota bacterium]
MFKQYLNNFKILSLGFLRDKQTIFFVLVLPLLFMFIFGSLYSDTGQQRQDRVLIYLSDEATISSAEIEAVLADNQSLTFEYVETLAEGEELLRDYDGEILMTVGDNSLEFSYNPARIQDNPAFEQQAMLVARELDIRRSGLKEFLQPKIIDSGEATANFQFLSLFPGVIALGIASSGLFVIIELFLYHKEKGVLKRLAASPLNRNSFTFALISSRIPASLLSTILVLAASRLIFDLRFEINWLLFIPYIIIGTIIMMGLGALITLFASSADSGFQAGSIMITVMIFFSGVYFPIEFLPSYFQTASRFLPLTYLARGFQQIMGVSPLEPGRLALETGGLLIISLILIVFVSKKSSWAAD